MKNLFYKWIFLSLTCLQAYAEDGETKHLKIGNFAISTSQQPGPLISFGENVIDKGQVQLFFLADGFFGKHKYCIDAVPSLNYGITDNLSIYFNVPVAIKYHDQHGDSDGFEDASVQLEYAYYTKDETCYVNSASIVTNVSFPSGSANKDPYTGFGTPAFFIGTTYNHTAIDWFYFTSYGATFTGSKNGTKIGDIYLYQFGFGRNICNLPGWIFAWMIELDGQYAKHNKFSGVKDHDSGGNVIYATPSLWISSEKLIIQIGAGYAIQQNLFGDQGRNAGLLALSLGWTF